jgi:IclR family KDG regulon transcriptional repressor
MTRAVPALSRGLDILELFLERETLSAADVTDRLGLPRTTAHELLSTLVGRSYLVPVATQPTRYRLGVRLFQLGGQFAAQVDLVREAQLVAEGVAAQCDETVHVAVLEGTDVYYEVERIGPQVGAQPYGISDKPPAQQRGLPAAQQVARRRSRPHLGRTDVTCPLVLYIAKVDSTHPVRMVSAVGRRLPAHCTAVGKVLLAALPPEAFAARFTSGSVLPSMTSRSITSVARLHDHLADVSASGLAYDDCESNEAVCCVAAPVRDHTGAVVAAMSISVPTVRWNRHRKREWSGLVRRSAGTLSERLGHRGAPANGPGEAEDRTVVDSPDEALEPT